MHWIVLAALTTTGWAMYSVFIKLSSGLVHPILGYIVLNLTALVLGGGFLAYLVLAKGEKLFVTSSGALLCAAAGVAVLVSELSVFYAFLQKAPLSIFYPLASAGGVALATLIAFLFMGEQVFQVRTLIGIVLAIASIYCLSSG
jgi:multidrug transporter EmrE-like cation transporter